MVLYLALVICVLKLLRPRQFKAAFKATWDGVNGAVLNHDPKDAIMQLISNYLARIEHNKNLNENDACLLYWATRIFIALVFLMVVLTLFALRA
jgi:hypothetical protein